MSEKQALAISREQFLDCLTKSGLVSAGDIGALQNGLAPDKLPGDSSAMAGELVKQKKLTPYQASILAKGQFQGLVYGDYRVQDKLGEGGMGLVFKAEHRHLKRKAALKVLHPSVTQSEEAVKRFHREVEAVARLQHPNIITAYDASIQDGSYWLAMEYVDGIDLGRLVKEQGPLPVDKAVDYLIQAAHGLEHSHKQGVVHRDIKPSNLLLDADGTVRILDMGLVRFTDAPAAGTATSPDGLTQTGDIMGSFDYIAPEQAIDTKRADGRADIYSLGCTLYFLLTGKAPYTGDTSMQKLLAHRENAIPSIRKVRPEAPLALEGVFHRLVAKKADDRYTTMTEVIADLQACRPRPAGPDGQETAKAPPPASGRSALPGIALLFCGTLCVVAGVAGAVLLEHEAASRAWPIPEDFILVSRIGAIAGAALAGFGLLLCLVDPVRLLLRASAAGRTAPFTSAPWPRRLLGALLGLLVGVIAGAAVGGALASANTAEEVRRIGTVAIGAFVGAAFGGRRAWLLVLGLALVGYFIGGEVGRQGLHVQAEGLAIHWDAHTLAFIGFGVIGALVGIVLGADRREVPLPPVVLAGETKTAASRSLPSTSEDLAAGKTVRRLSGKT